MRRDPRTMYLVWRASETLRVIADRESPEGRLSLPKHVILSYLRNNRNFTAAELARKIGVSPQSLNETIAALEKAGLLEKYFRETNRKSKYLRITPAGLTALLESENFMDRVEEIAFAGLEPRHVEQVRSYMQSIIASCPS